MKLVTLWSFIYGQYMSSDRKFDFSLEANKVMNLIIVQLSLALKHNLLTSSQPAHSLQASQCINKLESTMSLSSWSILVNLPIPIYRPLLEHSVVSFRTALYINPPDPYLSSMSSKPCCSPYITSMKSLEIDLRHD